MTGAHTHTHAALYMYKDLFDGSKSFCSPNKRLLLDIVLSNLMYLVWTQSSRHFVASEGDNIIVADIKLGNLFYKSVSQ